MGRLILLGIFEGFFFLVGSVWYKRKRLEGLNCFWRGERNIEGLEGFLVREGGSRDLWRMIRGRGCGFFIRFFNFRLKGLRVFFGKVRLTFL